MTAYLIFFFATITCAGIAIYPKLRLPAVLAIFLLLALFSGIRFETGWDYEAYQYFYDSLSNSYLYEIFNENGPVQLMGFEPGFAILIWLCNSLDANYQIVLALVTVGLCLYSVFRLDPDALPFFIVIYLWYGYYHNFSIVRQGIAGAIVFLALVIGDKKKTLSFFSYLIAISLHYSALVLSPIIWLIIRFSTKRILIGSIILCWVLSSSEVFRGVLLPTASLIVPERWLNLITVEQMTGKVGVSFILVEYSLAALALVFITKQGPAISFARGILIYKILTYGLFNDVSIIWERTSSFADSMYAASLSIILVWLIKEGASNPKLIRVLFMITLLGLGLYVFAKYERMLNSEVRIEGEKSHYDRFIPYKSILD